MPAVPLTLHLPDNLWHAVQALARQDGDANTVIRRAIEEYVTATQKRRGCQRPGKYQNLIKGLSLPVAALTLSARPATALRTLTIRYVYELVQKSRLNLFRLPNVGGKSLREIKDKLAALGLTLGVTLASADYTDAVTAAVGASMGAAQRET